MGSRKQRLQKELASQTGPCIASLAEKHLFRGKRFVRLRIVFSPIWTKRHFSNGPTTRGREQEQRFRPLWSAQTGKRGDSPPRSLRRYVPAMLQALWYAPAARCLVCTAVTRTRLRRAKHRRAIGSVTWLPPLCLCPHGSPVDLSEGLPGTQEWTQMLNCLFQQFTSHLSRPMGVP